MTRKSGRTHSCLTPVRENTTHTHNLIAVSTVVEILDMSWNLKINCNKRSEYWQTELEPEEGKQLRIVVLFPGNNLTVAITFRVYRFFKTFLAFPLRRSVPEQRGYRLGHPVAQLPAVRRRGEGVPGRSFGQDGDLPLPVLDPAALRALHPARRLAAQSGGEVRRGPPACQVQGARHAQTRLGQTQVPGLLTSPLVLVFVFVSTKRYRSADTRPASCFCFALSLRNI